MSRFLLSYKAKTAPLNGSQVKRMLDLLEINENIRLTVEAPKCLQNQNLDLR